MKNLTLGLGLLFSATSAFASTDATLREVVPTPAEIYSSALRVDDSAPEVDPPSDGTVDFSQIQVLGEKAVQILMQSKPVVNVKRDSVSVVPGGITAWTQLSNWHEPAEKIFELTIPGNITSVAATLRLKVTANWGGGVDGRGHYLANVIVVPTAVHVGLGWRCDVSSEHHDPVNIGNAADPVAGLGFDINYHCSSHWVDRKGVKDYFVTGKGEIQEL